LAFCADDCHLNRSSYWPAVGQSVAARHRPGRSAIESNSLITKALPAVTGPCNNSPAPPSHSGADRLASPVVRRTASRQGSDGHCRSRQTFGNYRVCMRFSHGLAYLFGWQKYVRSGIDSLVATTDHLISLV